jgi:hypothetical protein
MFHLCECRQDWGACKGRGEEACSNGDKHGTGERGSARAWQRAEGGAAAAERSEVSAADEDGGDGRGYLLILLLIIIIN